MLALSQYDPILLLLLSVIVFFLGGAPVSFRSTGRIANIRLQLLWVQGIASLVQLCRDEEYVVRPG